MGSQSTCQGQSTSPIVCSDGADRVFRPLLPMSTPLIASTVTAIPTTVVGHDPSTRTHRQAHLWSWDLRRFRSNLVGGLLRSRPGLQIGTPAYNPWFPPAEGKVSTNRNSNQLEMAVSRHRTHTQTPPHLVRTGTRTDMGASLPWDRMVLMGRIQHLTHPIRSCTGNETRPRALTDQLAPLVLLSARG